MGKSRKPWWNYVKYIIREYPELKREMETPRETRITSRICGNGYGGEGNSSPVERAVIHDLSPQKQRKYDAVLWAIEQTKEQNKYDYDVRMKIIEMVYFQNKKTIVGAALAVGCATSTAGAWQGEFIRLVAEALDLP